MGKPAQVGGCFHTPTSATNADPNSPDAIEVTTP